MQIENVHNKFEDINHTPLKVFNRVMLMLNLNETISTQEANAYAESFSDPEKKQMYIMAAFIKNKGVDQARKIVTKGLQVVH